MSAGFPLLGEQAAAPDGRPSSDLLGAEGGIELHLDHSFQGASPPTSEEEERTDGGAMIPMALDPSFVKQLVALFGAPDLKTGGSAPTSSNEPVRFDIPYSLAEQIYMHWCSSLIDEEDDERFEEESRELQSIMDIEYAMKIAQEEVSFIRFSLPCVLLLVTSPVTYSRKLLSRKSCERVCPPRCPCRCCEKTIHKWLRWP